MCMAEEVKMGYFEKTLVSLVVVFIVVGIFKLMNRLFGCQHEWQEFTQEVTYNKSRRCYKCGESQTWAGYWKST